MSRPEVSVVMSVFNEAATLPETLSSVLTQTHCEFEFVVIDDGSTDASAEVLESWSTRDSRLKVLHQENTGLTRALIRGCNEAVGEFIARQDAGDMSLPGRLSRQVQRLRSDPACAAVACHANFVGPEGEFLYVARGDEHALNAGLQVGREPPLGPPHHGSVMMRKADYHRAGGYRAVFHFAQDLDLWTRLAESRRFGMVDAVLYQARLHPGSISGMHTAEQRRLTALIGAATAARRAGGDESALLQRAAAISPQVVGTGRGRRTRLAIGNYFIGSCLLDSAPSSAERYFREAVRQDPRHWRAWLRWLQAKAYR